MNLFLVNVGFIEPSDSPDLIPVSIFFSVCFNVAGGFTTLFECFSYQWQLMIFHWSLHNNKAPQVSRTLLNILTDLYSFLVWVVPIHTPISNSSTLLFKPLGTVLGTLIAIGVTVTLIFHCFLSSPARSQYWSLFLLF